MSQNKTFIVLNHLEFSTPRSSFYIISKIVGALLLSLTLASCDAGKVDTLTKQVSLLTIENASLKNQLVKTQQKVELVSGELDQLRNGDRYAFKNAAEFIPVKQYDSAISALLAFLVKYPSSNLTGEAKNLITQARKSKLNLVKRAKADQIEAKRRLRAIQEANRLAAQGFIITDVRSNWKASQNLNEGQVLLVPEIRFKIKNVSGVAIAELSFKANFVLVNKGEKEALGNDSFSAVGYGDAPLEPGYTKEIFMESGTGYVDNGGSFALSIALGEAPVTTADIYFDRGNGEKKIKTISVGREFKR